MTAVIDHRSKISSPWMMPLSVWKNVLTRSWKEAGDDNLALIAAGVAFYAFLALVPLFGATVLSYGLIASTKTVVHDMKGLTTIMPGDAAKLVSQQLKNIVETSGTKKGFGLLLALGLALFGARSAAGSIITALNMAYEEKEKRSFIVVTLLALAMTLGAVLIAVIAIIAIAALGHLEKMLPAAPTFLVVIGKLMSYVALALAGAAGAATLYRYGPSREEPAWVWLTAGSVFAALCWFILTFGFGLYVSHLGNYNATYGSLGAVVVLLTWLWLSSYILLFGAEINSEIEREAASNTGVGPPTLAAGSDVCGHPVTPNANVADLSLHTAPTQLPLVRSHPGLPLQSLAADFMFARTSCKFTKLFGFAHSGLLSTGLLTLGQMLIRRKGKTVQGLVIIGIAAGLSWVARERD